MAEKNKEVIDAPVDRVPVADSERVGEPVVEHPAEELPAASDDVFANTPTVIVVDAPVPPRKKGNQLLSVLLAIPATAIFVVLLAGIGTVAPALVPSGFLAVPAFYFPALLLFVGLILVNLVLNRAGWWAHIIGSVVVGAIVWFGTASLVLISDGMLTMNQAEANETFFASLFSPLAIIGALLAREIAVWTGAILARRGRALAVRNAEAYAAFEREKAELIPTAV